MNMIRTTTATCPYVRSLLQWEQNHQKQTKRIGLSSSSQRILFEMDDLASIGLRHIERSFFWNMQWVRLLCFVASHARSVVEDERNKVPEARCRWQVWNASLLISLASLPARFIHEWFLNICVACSIVAEHYHQVPCLLTASYYLSFFLNFWRHHQRPVHQLCTISSLSILLKNAHATFCPQVNASAT